MQDYIRIRGARVHNLKNISVSIPHNQLTVVTGVSGSGKSSLAFDTIYAEGQRRYVESLSAYARQFLERMEKPAVEDIDGIAPGVAIRQKNTTRNPRSTVATSTECYDFLRLLYARVGHTICPNCNLHVRKDTVDQVAQRVLAEPEGSRWYVLFPVTTVAHPESQALRDHLFDLRKKGFNRLFQNGRTFEFSTPESLLDIDFSQPVFVLADRIAVAPGSAPAHCRYGGDRLPRGRRSDLRMARCRAPPALQREVRLQELRHGVCRAGARAVQLQLPGGRLPALPGLRQHHRLRHGSRDSRPRPFTSQKAPSSRGPNPSTAPGWAISARPRAPAKCGSISRFATSPKTEREVVFESIRGFFAHLEQKKYKLHVRVFLSRYRGYALCPACRGGRLRKEATYVQVGGKPLPDLVRMNIAEALAFFDSLELSPEESGVAGKVLVEIRQRLKFLNDVGLDYLTLDRLSATLSGGEAQRIQLATCLGSRLVGACYVLDEPSIGLHSRDTGRLIRILEELRGIGNTILVVEHDPEVMRAADHIIDMGPGAGELGGEIIYEGSFSDLARNGNGSLTARYLRGEMRVSHKHAKHAAFGRIRFFGARTHNLKNIDVAIPLGMMVVITGVSGSGKSTLVHDVIYRSMQALHKAPGAAPADEADDSLESSARLSCRRVEGAEPVRQTILIDQSPIGRTPRSNPVTYIKAFDLIRALFASTKDAERRGYTAGHFSFNIPGGRCETCQGDGTVTVEMQFLADVELICEECKGTRYKSGILEIRHNGLNIHEVLQLTVREAMEFFRGQSKLVSRLKVLDDVGLGYLRLGQSATTLSGGEAQRVKLAAHLAQASSAEGTLFIFDEPTTGLHFDDIAKLLGAFEQLIEHGASLLVIEHNMDVIKAADWVIDLGPEGGDRGGYIVAQGTPEEIARAEGSHTGRFLRAALA